MSVRVEHIGDATLYLGDCRDIKWCGADVVVSDPPYSIPHKFSDQVGAAGNGTRALSWGWDQEMSAEEIVNVFYGLFPRVDAAFVFCGLRQATGLAMGMERAGLVDKMAAWTKLYPPPPAPGNWWPSGFELAVYGYRSGAYFGDTNPARSNVFRYDALRNGNSEKSGHPTQKPLDLMLRIVNAICPPSGSVFDPFMGSGTTGVACIKLGRKFFGIEIDETYFDIACKRIEAEARQGRLSLTPAELEVDSLGSCDVAVTAIGERWKQGSPIPESMLSRKARP